jgi:hypothetical protein
MKHRSAVGFRRADDGAERGVGFGTHKCAVGEHAGGQMVLPGLEPGRRLTGTRFHTTSVFTAPEVRGPDCPFTVASDYWR